eukprot:g1230.t1
MAGYSYRLFGLALCSAALALEVDVETYGAVADATVHLTNATLSTAGFNKAIAAVSAAGGGVVHARAAGTYKTGRVEMLSHVRLEIGPAATVQGSHQAEHWTARPAACPNEHCDCPPDGGNQTGVLGGLFYAARATNFSLGGGGTVNGAAKAWNKPPAQGKDNPLGLGRCNMFVFEMCSDVVVEDLHIEDSSEWTLNPRYSQRLAFRRLNISAPTLGSHGHNTDGFDPWACEDVVFEDSTYSAGDDCVAVKCGKDASPSQPWECGVPTRNVHVRNISCGASHGLTVGSEMSAGVEGVVIEDVTMGSCDAPVRIKSQCGRSGYVRNVTYRNIYAAEAQYGVYVDMQYFSSGTTECAASNTSAFQDIHVHNVTVASATKAAYAIVGLDVVDRPADPVPIKGLTLENVTVRKFKSAGQCTFAQLSTGGAIAPAIPVGKSCSITRQ